MPESTDEQDESPPRIEAKDALAAIQADNQRLKDQLAAELKGKAEREASDAALREAELAKNKQWQELADLEKNKTKQAQAERDAQLLKAAESDRRTKEFLLDRELSLALAGNPIVPEGAKQLQTLLRGQFEVLPDGDSWKVAAKDGKPVADTVKALLATKDYSHFLRAEARGSHDSNPGKQTTATGEQEVDDPEERIFALHKSRRAGGKQFGFEARIRKS